MLLRIGIPAIVLILACVGFCCLRRRKGEGQNRTTRTESNYRRENDLLVGRYSTEVELFWNIRGRHPQLPHGARVICPDWTLMVASPVGCGRRVPRTQRKDGQGQLLPPPWRACARDHRIRLSNSFRKDPNERSVFSTACTSFLLKTKT